MSTSNKDKNPAIRETRNSKGDLVAVHIVGEDEPTFETSKKFPQISDPNHLISQGFGVAVLRRMLLERNPDGTLYVVGKARTYAGRRILDNDEACHGSKFLASHQSGLYLGKKNEKTEHTFGGLTYFFKEPMTRAAAKAALTPLLK